VSYRKVELLQFNLPVLDSSSLIQRNLLLQFFKPVQDDDDFISPIIKYLFNL